MIDDNDSYLALIRWSIWHIDLVWFLIKEVTEIEMPDWYDQMFTYVLTVDHKKGRNTEKTNKVDQVNPDY